MKKEIIIVIVVLVIVFSFLFIVGYILIKDREEAIQESQEGCDIFVVTTQKPPIDCYEPRFYNRMQDRNEVGTYCFMNTENYVFLKCYWEKEQEILNETEGIFDNCIFVSVPQEEHCREVELNDGTIFKDNCWINAVSTMRCIPEEEIKEIRE